MLTLQQQPFTSSNNSGNDHDHPDEEPFRDIHALTPPLPPPPADRCARWESGSHRSSSLSVSSEAPSSDNFMSMSREFNALVIAGSTIQNPDENSGNNSSSDNYQLARIGEDQEVETNPLAIVPDYGAVVEEERRQGRSLAVSSGGGEISVSVQRVKKEEAETKISAWENAKIAKINNRFKREEAVISGWESEQVQKATSWMKKVERKLEEKRARALEKMQNKVAKARRKAEERRASAEGKRGTKVARILDIANLMRAVGRPPVKRSFF